MSVTAGQGTNMVTIDKKGAFHDSQGRYADKPGSGLGGFQLEQPEATWQAQNVKHAFFSGQKNVKVYQDMRFKEYEYPGIYIYRAEVGRYPDGFGFNSYAADADYRAGNIYKIEGDGRGNEGTHKITRVNLDSGASENFSCTNQDPYEFITNGCIGYTDDNAKYNEKWFGNLNISNYSDGEANLEDLKQAASEMNVDLGDVSQVYTFENPEDYAIELAGNDGVESEIEQALTSFYGGKSIWADYVKIDYNAAGKRLLEGQRCTEVNGLYYLFD